jgi:uncharacterized membrane protein YdjX (TVP38/TMEM64 family)/rhodanese-related sulfurtransferase
MTLRAVLPRLLVGLAILAGVLLLGLNRELLEPTTVEGAVGNLGPWSPVAYVALFALGTILFVPGALLALAGGVLFGPVWGTVLNLIGATLGATVAFLLARYVAADWVRRTAGPRLERIIKGVEEEGWRFVAFVRLMPLIPFNLLNYALGLTRIPLLEYAVASVVCMAPGTLAYTWLGHAGREVVAGKETAIHYGLMGLTLLVAVAFLPRLLRRLKSEEAASWIEVEDLAARLEGSKPIAVIDVRGHDEFAGPLGHIPNARNMPLADLPRRLDELGSLIETPVVLVCKTEKRSANAAALLGAVGFRDVVVLRGGMVRWNEAKMPVAGRVSAEA